MERIFQAVCRAAIVAVGIFPFLSPATAGEYSGLDTGGPDEAAVASFRQQCRLNVCDRGGWFFGAEATYLAPLYSTGDASFSLLDTSVDPPVGVTLGSDFGKADQLTGAPRVVFGYTGRRGLGWQFRYWELNSTLAGNDFPDAIVGNQAQLLGGNDAFEAYAIDLELTQEFRTRRWDWLGSFGVRHAMFDQSRFTSVSGAVNDDIFSLSSWQGAAFHGTGLTFGLAGLKPIHPCRGLSFYLNNRLSTVFGSAKTRAITNSQFSGTGGFAGSLNGAIDESDETLFILETGAGVQWSRCVRGYNSRMFARIGVEYQYWTNSGGSAIAESFSGTPGSSLGVASARGGSHDVHLVGLAAMAGFAW